MSKLLEPFLRSVRTRWTLLIGSASAYGWIWEKEISAISGGLVFQKKIQDIENKGKIDPKVVDLLKTKVLTKLPNQRYLEIAQDKTGGQAGEFILYVNGKTLLVQVNGVGDNGWKVTMDMTTGQILK